MRRTTRKMLSTFIALAMLLPAIYTDHADARLEGFPPTEFVCSLKYFHISNPERAEVDIRNVPFTLDQNRRSWQLFEGIDQIVSQSIYSTQLKLATKGLRYFATRTRTGGEVRLVLTVYEIDFTFDSTTRLLEVSKNENASEISLEFNVTSANDLHGLITCRKKQ